MDLSDSYSDLVSLRECARCFEAESIVARSQGNYSTAMQRSLDALELGSKLCTGGAVDERLSGLASHVIGYRQVERLVPLLSADTIPGVLERVRRVRMSWSPLSEMLESERIHLLAGAAEALRERGRQSLQEQIEVLGGLRNEPSLWDIVQFELMPRRLVLANLDYYFRRRKEEGRKPFRLRAPVAAPSDPWSQLVYLEDRPDFIWKYEFAQTELAILEVALAVRLYRLKHGRYPANLGAIERRYLPSVPADEWGQPVAYRVIRGKPAIYSLGPDGKDDGGQAANVRHLGKTARGDLVFGKLNWSAWPKESP